jgi:hypothetical protein
MSEDDKVCKTCGSDLSDKDLDEELEEEAEE